jgi:hypothetical protein
MRGTFRKHKIGASAFAVPRRQTELRLLRRPSTHKKTWVFSFPPGDESRRLGANVNPDNWLTYYRHPDKVHTTAYKPSTPFITYFLFLRPNMLSHAGVACAVDTSCSRDESFFTTPNAASSSLNHDGRQ